MAIETLTNVRLMQWRIRLLGVISIAIYAAIAVVSLGFRDEVLASDRPILTMLGLFGVACLLYLASLFLLARVTRRPDGTRLASADANSLGFRMVLFFSILFRLILLPSVPIQEVDFYRYLWDGRVLWQGGNPYRFAPAQIDAANVDEPSEMSSLVALREASGPVSVIFSSVHHRQVPTIYPPAAQVFFAICAAITPAAAPVWLHIFVLKFLLIMVDVAILFAMRGLLRQVGFAESWCVAYGWCPLAVKEVANSAHVDGLAVLFTLGTLQLLIQAARSPSGDSAYSFRWAGAGVSLGLAVLSKTYPIVLIPLVMSFAFAKIRARALVPLVVCLAVITAGYLPFLDWPPLTGSAVEATSIAGPSNDGQRPWSGLGTFLTQWQMNDLLFMVVHENLRQPHVETNRLFVVTSTQWRQESTQRVEALLAKFGVATDVDPAFVMTQALMGLLLAGLSLRWVWRVFRIPEPLVLLRSVFLVLAWAWLLSSAQNPWYVLWFLPLMPFACCRSWFLVPCLAFVYYLRFWLVQHCGCVTANGECPVFDFGWVWAEHGIVLVALASESLTRAYGWFGVSAAPPLCVVPSSAGFSAASTDAGTGSDS